MADKLRKKQNEGISSVLEIAKKIGRASCRERV